MINPLKFSSNFTWNFIHLFKLFVWRELSKTSAYFLILQLVTRWLSFVVRALSCHFPGKQCVIYFYLHNIVLAFVLSEKYWGSTLYSWWHNIMRNYKLEFEKPVPPRIYWCIPLSIHLPFSFGLISFAVVLLGGNNHVSSISLLYSAVI